MAQTCFLNPNIHLQASFCRVQSMLCAVPRTFRLTACDMLCSNSSQHQHNLWAARYSTWLLIQLTPKGVVFSFLFLFINMTLVCVQIRIPTQNLQATFSEVKGRHVWGTDVYTDDSDIVCAVMHCGYYNASLKKPVAMVSEMRVVIQLLPPQIEYPVFVRNGIRSRAWWAGGTSCSYKVHPSSSLHDAATHISCLCTSCSYMVHPSSSLHDAATHTSCLCTLCSPPLLVQSTLRHVELAAMDAPTRCITPCLTC